MSDNWLDEMLRTPHELLNEGYAYLPFGYHLQPVDNAIEIYDHGDLVGIYRGTEAGMNFKSGERLRALVIDKAVDLAWDCYKSTLDDLRWQNTKDMRAPFRLFHQQGDS